MGKHEQLKGILYEILDDNKGWLSLGEIENVLIEKYSFIKEYKSSMKKILNSLLFIIIATTISYCAEVQFPAYSGFVNDFANVIDPENASKQKETS